MGKLFARQCSRILKEVYSFLFSQAQTHICDFTLFQIAAALQQCIHFRDSVQELPKDAKDAALVESRSAGKSFRRQSSLDFLRQIHVFHQPSFFLEIAPCAVNTAGEHLRKC